MRRRKNSALIEIKIYQGIILMIVALVVAGGILYYAQAKNANQYPRLANYILGTLPTDNDSVVRPGIVIRPILCTKIFTYRIVVGSVIPVVSR